MAAPASAGGRFRQRKISTKQTLQILKQSQISEVDNDDLQQRDLQEIETGVDKNEEDEVHLQKILKATGLTHTADTYIPTPDASKEWLEASKYYSGTFQHPESYIKSSCQMEDYSGTLYNMDEEDDEFLKPYNEQLAKDKKDQLTEDEFEIMMYNFEKTISDKQPFLVTDPTHILSLNEIKLALLQVDRSSVENVTQVLAEDLNVHPFITHFDAKLPKKPRQLKVLIELHGTSVYDHFKKRKIARAGNNITPILKFTGEDDNDAYICFRQRQFRQQRKTRRADVQSSEKLLKLFRELKATKDLNVLVAQRELLRLESIKTEHEIFELRCRVKTIKRELGITDSDEDLIAHKKKKLPPPVVQPAAAAVDVKEEKKKGLAKSSNNANIDRNKAVDGTLPDTPQQFQPYVKLPPSKIPDMELETVDRLLSSKELSMQKFVDEKLKKRKLAEAGFTNFTDDPYNPWLNITTPYQEILDSSHIPYSSIASSLFDVESFGYVPNAERYIEKGIAPNEGDVILINPETGKISKKSAPEKFNPFYMESALTSGTLMTLRNRVGRLGQTYIDRRGMVKIPDLTRDDFENEEEWDAFERKRDMAMFDSETHPSPLSEDPSCLNNISNDTQVIRFGSMLVSKSYETLRETVLQHRQHYIQRLRLQQQQMQQNQLAQQQAQQQGQQARKNSPLPPAAAQSGSIAKANAWCPVAVASIHDPEHDIYPRSILCCVI